MFKKKKHTNITRGKKKIKLRVWTFCVLILLWTIGACKEGGSIDRTLSKGNAFSVEVEKFGRFNEVTKQINSNDWNSSMSDELDSDEDGLSDRFENEIKTNPRKNDTFATGHGDRWLAKRKGVVSGLNSAFMVMSTAKGCDPLWYLCDDDNDEVKDWLEDTGYYYDTKFYVFLGHAKTITRTEWNTLLSNEAGWETLYNPGYLLSDKLKMHMSPHPDKDSAGPYTINAYFAMKEAKAYAYSSGSTNLLSIVIDLVNGYDFSESQPTQRFFYTNPATASTDKDPYNDGAEVKNIASSGSDGAAIEPSRPEAHPLVAAYPILNINQTSYDLENIEAYSTNNETKLINSFSNTIETSTSFNWHFKHSIDIAKEWTAIPKVSVSTGVEWGVGGTNTDVSRNTVGHDTWTTNGRTEDHDSACVAELKVDVYLRNDGSAWVSGVKPTIAVFVGERFLASKTYPTALEQLAALPISGVDNGNVSAIPYRISEDQHGNALCLSTDEANLVNNAGSLNFELGGTGGTVYYTNPDTGHQESFLGWEAYMGAMEEVNTHFILQYQGEDDSWNSITHYVAAYVSAAGNLPADALTNTRSLTYKEAFDLIYDFDRIGGVQDCGDGKECIQTPVLVNGLRQFILLEDLTVIASQSELLQLDDDMSNLGLEHWWDAPIRKQGKIGIAGPSVSGPRVQYAYATDFGGAAQPKLVTSVYDPHGIFAEEAGPDLLYQVEFYNGSSWQIMNPATADPGNTGTQKDLIDAAGNGIYTLDLPMGYSFASTHKIRVKNGNGFIREVGVLDVLFDMPWKDGGDNYTSDFDGTILASDGAWLTTGPNFMTPKKVLCKKNNNDYDWTLSANPASFIPALQALECPPGYSFKAPTSILQLDYARLAIGNEEVWVNWTDLPNRDNLLHEESVPRVLNGGASSDYYAFGKVIALGDFNGDGYDDVAIGADKGIEAKGIVIVYYGTPGGLFSNRQYLEDSSFWALNESGDYSGSELAVGDFDNDGYEDLVIGGPQEYYQGRYGKFVVVWGAAKGLNTGRARSMYVGPNLDASFAQSLTTGDFDGDGKDDLAVGAPFDLVGGNEIDAGSVYVYYGKDLSSNDSNSIDSNSINTTLGQLWHADSSGIISVAEDNDNFGWDLTSGDFDGNGVDDLVISLLGETNESSGYTNTGYIITIYGSSGVGLTSSGNSIIDITSCPMANLKSNLHFGETLSAGDFNNDGKDDLVVGVPKYNNFSSASNGGTVFIFYDVPNANNWDTAYYDRLDQASADVNSNPEHNDLFGASLAVGDFNGDNYDDLMVGAPGETWNFRNPIVVAAGYGNQFKGSSGGLVGDQSINIGDGEKGLPGALENFDYFAFFLASGDINGDGRADLVIGSPFEDESHKDEGAVHIIYADNDSKPLTDASNQQVFP